MSVIELDTVELPDGSEISFADQVAREGLIRCATCSTASGVAAKVATTSDEGYVLKAGTSVIVTFANKDTSTNPTLNVDNKGAKPIFYLGQAVGQNIINADTTYLLSYDGTNFNLIGSVQGGHTIIDSSGTTYPQRSNLKINNATITDDSTNDTTIVEPAGSDTNFVGTRAEWNALTDAEKEKYTTYDITDDHEYVINFNHITDDMIAPYESDTARSAHEKLESQVLYTALMTDTLIEED